jgi:DNA polymerase-3 subunit gamma/tau
MSGVASGNLGHLFLRMTHTALARKYRPRRFEDLAAQEHVAAGLRGAIAKNRVAHAYLLTGPRGVGKTSAARILAMALNCELRPTDGDVPTGEPCGTCDSCQRIWSGGANLDVVEIDAASNRGVDDARDLRERAMYAASGPDRHKVYIIDEAHMLTREAWNALLKILEEPPPRVVFVFATTEPQKIANTAAPVLSRMQRFDFRRIGNSTIIDRLRYVVDAEQVRAEDDALTLIAGVAGGGMRDALSVLDQALAFGDGEVKAERVRETLGLLDDELYGEVLDFVAERRTVDVFPFVARLTDAGADLAEFINGVGGLLRSLLVRLLGGEPEGVTESLRQTINSYADRFVAGDLLRMLRLLQDAEQSIRRSPNARLHVETLLLHWTLLDRTVEIAEVMAALSAAPNSTAPAADRRIGGSVNREDPDAKARDRSHDPAPEQRTADPPIRPMPGPLTLETLETSWGEVRSTVGRKKRMLREALGHAEPVAVTDGKVELRVADSEVHLEGLERNRAAIETAIGQVFGCTVQVRLRPGGPPAEQGASVETKRLDQVTDKEQRLRAYRQQDQSLDAVAENFDLELLD